MTRLAKIPLAEYSDGLLTGFKYKFEDGSDFVIGELEEENREKVRYNLILSEENYSVSVEKDAVHLGDLKDSYDPSLDREVLYSIDQALKEAQEEAEEAVETLILEELE